MRAPTEHFYRSGIDFQKTGTTGELDRIISGLTPRWISLVSLRSGASGDPVILFELRNQGIPNDIYGMHVQRLDHSGVALRRMMNVTNGLAGNTNRSFQVTFTLYLSILYKQPKTNA